jgi:DNA-binding transcriptional MerR regulator
MRIGELARRAGVSVQTIRFDERKNLLRKPLRSAADYRLYNPQNAAIVRTLRQRL